MRFPGIATPLALLTVLLLPAFASAQEKHNLVTAEQVDTLRAQVEAMKPQRSLASRTAELLQSFPDDGPLVCLHVVALAMDDRTFEAAEHLQHARDLGVMPENAIPAPVIERIERDAAQRDMLMAWLGRSAWLTLCCGVAYAVVILLMTAAGVMLAMLTRGSGALDLLRDPWPAKLVVDGQVVRLPGETLLARLYGLVLSAGLILFYASIPFAIVGVLAVSGLLAYLIFLGGPLWIKCVALLAIGGAHCTLALFKSLFAKPASGSFGLPKNAAQCPRLHDLLAEVAECVDTDAVDDVFIGPGAAIGVHQQGSGPFRIFGVNRRVLTLGLSTLRFLTIGELKAMLAHEYAHFSHQDTFYNRFLYQFHVSIEDALDGILDKGIPGHVVGIGEYVNPFYWIVWLYQKSYLLLSAGWSRSREYLADRTAATLYGRDQFSGALTKVCTDGRLFEMTIHAYLNHMQACRQPVVNMYEAFQQFRNAHIAESDRDSLYQTLLAERGSLFASHPNFAERIEALKSLPGAPDLDARPALELFDRPEELEQELTHFLTGHMAQFQRAPAAMKEAFAERS